MNINIKATGITLTDAISSYVNKRMEKVASFIGDDSTVQCDIELGKTTEHHNKGEIFKAEIHIVGSGINVYNTATKQDLYLAIDEMKYGALSELKSGRKKNASRIRRGGAKIKAMMKGMWPWGE